MGYSNKLLYKRRKREKSMETIISVSAFVLAITIVIMAIIKKLRPSFVTSKVVEEDIKGVKRDG